MFSTRYTCVKYLLFLFLFSVTFTLNLRSQNESKARQVLNRALSLVENPGGAKLDYEIKVTRLYTQRGTTWYRGNKSLLRAKKSTLWFDGKTVWVYNHKTNEVTIHKAKQSNRRGLAEMLAYTRKAEVSMTEESDYYRLRIISRDSDAPAHEAIALVNKKNYHPVQLRMRKGIVWITINISNFDIGNWPDEMFRFDAKKYPNIKLIDKR